MKDVASSFAWLASVVAYSIVLIKGNCLSSLSVVRVGQIGPELEALELPELDFFLLSEVLLLWL